MNGASITPSVRGASPRRFPGRRAILALQGISPSASPTRYRVCSFPYVTAFASMRSIGYCGA
jgi:hypothetical protein